MLLVLGGLSVGLWLYLRKNTQESKPSIAAISTTSNFIVEIHQPQIGWSRLFKDSKYFSVLSNIESFQPVKAFCISADSLMKSNHQFGNAFSNSPLIISFSHAVSGKTEILLASNYSDIGLAEEMPIFLNGLFPQSGQIKETIFQQNKIYTITTSIASEKYYCSSAFGILLLSNSSKTIEDALIQLYSTKSILDDQGFAKAYKVAGKKTDATLFYNYKTSSTWVGKLINEEGNNMLSHLSNFATWTGIDISLKTEGLLLSGYTWQNINENDIAFFGKKPIEYSIASKLPQNVSGLFFFGAESLKESGLAYYQKTQKAKPNDSISQNLLGWMDKQMTVGILDNYDTLISENAILLVNSLDSAFASKSLSAMANENQKTDIKSLDENYNEISLKSLGNKGIFEKFFGLPVGLIQNNYYANLGKFVIFANNSLTLKNFINFYLSDKTLANYPPYLKITTELSSATNVFIYLKPASINKKIRHFLLPNYTEDIMPYLTASNSFDGFALQFSAQNDGYYTNGYLSYGESETDTLAEKEGWTASLDTTTNSIPLIIENSISNELEIIIQDNAHKLYCITTLGRIKWKLDLKESVRGEILYLKNFSGNKPALVAGTKNFIYAIGLNGEYLPNYPIELDAKCTSGLSVFDYENKDEYRMVYASGNEKIYNTDKQGKNVKGWALTKTEDDIIYPFQHVQAGGKDYLFYMDSEGKVKIYDRQGKRKAEAKGSFEPSLNNTLYAHKGKNAKNVGLYFSNTKGSVCYINTEGKVEIIELKQFTENHFFLAADLDNDGNIEFVFLDLNELRIYTRKKELLFSRKWEEELQIAPQLIKQSNTKVYLGLVTSESKQLHLLNEKGESVETFPRKGAGYFAVKFQEGKPSLVVTTDGGNILKIMNDVE